MQHEMAKVAGCEEELPDQASAGAAAAAAAVPKHEQNPDKEQQKKDDEEQQKKSSGKGSHVEDEGEHAGAEPVSPPARFVSG